MKDTEPKVELRTSVDAELGLGVDTLVLVSGIAKSELVSQALRLYFYQIGLSLPSSIHPEKATKTMGRGPASTRKVKK